MSLKGISFEEIRFVYLESSNDEGSNEKLNESLWET
jgi:hypothetical protein